MFLPDKPVKPRQYKKGGLVSAGTVSRKPLVPQSALVQELSGSSQVLVPKDATQLPTVNPVSGPLAKQRKTKSKAKPKRKNKKK